LSAKKEDQLAALKEHVERMKNLNDRAKTMVKVGNAGATVASATDFYLAEAELWLAREKGK